MKPQGTRVRVERVPLASRSINGMLHNPTLQVIPPPEGSPMTLEEIMYE
jgi:hypothetical protein